MTANQFTRWLCPSCGEDGFDSWNKAIFDGLTYADGEALPNPHMLGDCCHRCLDDAVIRYTDPGAPPRVIILGLRDGPGLFEDGFAAFEADPLAGFECDPAETRDADWSRGCLAARDQLQ